MQSSIPAVFMRGGTSRGLYFKKADLPDNRDLWDDILLKAFGSPDPRQVDGVGGTTSVTSKSCILSPSERDDCDIDYLFAQLAVDEAKVDYAPTCGNMLAGVGPYAIETGMIQAQDGETRVRIHQVNTGGLVEAVVPTPGAGRVRGRVRDRWCAGNGGTHSAQFHERYRREDGKTVSDWREDGNHRRRRCHHHRRGYAMHDYAGSRCRKNRL